MAHNLRNAPTANSAARLKFTTADLRPNGMQWLAAKCKPWPIDEGRLKAMTLKRLCTAATGMRL
eukprot:5361415-Amphidinium_carterae.1